MPESISEPVSVAIAILYQGDRYLMQLRDDTPEIVYPGVWGFFGGHIEPDEDPEVAVLRELEEEIGYTAPHVTLFESRVEAGIKRYVFYAPLTVDLEALTLTEGWDFGLWTADDVRRGDRYSDVAGQTRPIGKPHRKILLSFIDRIAPQLPEQLPEQLADSKQPD
jgi:8-oxo-dGTP pyrophosphatase MutT (NUDIX family)